MRRVLLAVSIAAAFLSAPALLAQGDIWKAGSARVEITPQSSVWMAGYAARTAPSSGVRMPIWAKALTLEDAAGNKGLIVTMDILSIPKDFSDKVRDYACRKYSLDNSRIILNASHTHSGPVLDNALPYIYPMSDDDVKVVKEYTKVLMQKTLRLIDEAFASMHPARVRTGEGFARIAVNRRHNPANPPATMTLQGPSDYAVPVIRIEDLEGTLQTVLFGYACHATTLCDNYLSGDYPGYAQAELEITYPGVTAMFFQGCGADQNPLPRDKVSQAVQYGKQLAASVQQVLSEDMRLQESSLRTCYEEIPLLFDKMESREQLSQMAAQDNYFGRWARAMVARLDKGEKFPASYPYPMSCWMIGAQRVFALGGEVTSGYSILLKERYGSDVIVMGYCHDVMTYIPTEALWHEGSYEVEDANKVYNLPARWTPDVEKTILEGVDKMLKENNF